MFLKLISIAFGSALGGISRYLLSKSINIPFFSVFPWGTFVVNILGCFLIGLVYGFIDKGINLNENMRLFLTVGFCGGFTTFSTFIHENFILFESNSIITVLVYATMSFAIGLLLVYGGYYITRI